jgi:hypothetical protein
MNPFSIFVILWLVEGISIVEKLQPKFCSLDFIGPPSIRMLMSFIGIIFDARS